MALPLFAAGAQDPAASLAQSMWAAQIDARTIRLSWNHIAGGAMYTVSCETGIKPLRVLGTVSPGVAVKDAIGLPRRVSYVIPGAEPGSVYRCYLQWASDPKSALSARVPFNEITPLIPGPLGAKVAVTVTAAATAPGEVTVTWNAIPGATAYTLGRAVVPNGFKTLCDVCSTNTTFVDRYAVAGAKHTYSVLPITPSGALLRGTSNTIVAAGTTDEIVAAGDPNVNPDLKRPSSVTATLSAATSVLVKWQAVDVAAGYDVFRSVNGGSLQLLGHLPAGAPPAIVEFADNISSVVGANQLTMRYAVKSTDANGRVTEPTLSNELTIASKAGTPTGTSSTSASNTRATATSSSSVTLTWSAPAGTIACSIQRSFGGGAFATIASLPAGTAQYVDTGAGLLDQQPRYQIVCGDPKIQAAVPFPIPVWSGPKPTTPPASSTSATVPANLRAVAVSPDSVKLTWGPPTSAIACAVRRSIRGEPYVILQVMPVGAWQYVDTTSSLMSMKPKYQLSCGDPKSPYPPVSFPIP